MIDTHVHVLDPARFPYPKHGAGYRPRADESGTLSDLRAISDPLGVTDHVVVAASVYGADNASLLAAADAAAGHARVVAAFDPAALATLESLARSRWVVGVRLNLIDDRRIGSFAQARDVLGAIRDAGLVACVQAPPAQVLRLVEGLDDLALVLDHLGRPDLDGGIAALSVLGTRPATWIKLSGGFRMPALGWPRPGAVPQRAAQAFAREAHLWGSDWPFINLPGQVRPSYAQTLAWAFALSDADFDANARALFWRQR